MSFRTLLVLGAAVAVGVFGLSSSPVLSAKLSNFAPKTPAINGANGLISSTTHRSRRIGGKFARHRPLMAEAV